MKKLTNSVSPFIMLLVPIFLMIGVLVLNLEKEIPAEKHQASISLQVPSFKLLIRNIF
ncbi:hypothetical protein [Daejeonella oryzae]|uniref:hypothetical protein n=1 Tax=Daejeonella oryzae TaxID=1122943 RepID=UPI0012DC6B84|nr:hypothetical protein [Daejeonella oryzae]